MSRAQSAIFCILTLHFVRQAHGGGYSRSLVVPSPCWRSPHFAAMAKTRCAQDGHIDTSCGFVNWYGRARGHQEWVQAEGVAGAKEPGAEHARAASEGPGAGAVEPGDAEDPGAKGVESGAGAAEPGVRAGTPGAAVGAQLPSQGQAPTPAEGADVGSEHDSVVTLSRTMGHTLGGI